VIFVTVGHQMPFDRLIRALDAWAQRADRADLFAQIGDGEYWPSHFQAVPFLTPQQYQQRMADADAVVAHAGTGTIIAAMQRGIPILVMPRRADLAETRNDHQIATAQHFAEAGYTLVAETETQLAARMDDLESWMPAHRLGDLAQPQLIERIQTFISQA
jgi:UDP-N-acetylglucosamine transferase subunit ALG13